MATHVLGVDVLRFVAALLVCLFHLTYWGAAAPGTTADALQGAASFPEFGRFTQAGWVGVEIFFVISGFVIAYTAQGKSAFGFFRSRLLRLMPGAIACASLTMIVALATSLFSPTFAVRAYLASIFFFPFPPWVDGVYWSLGIEVSFYGAIWLLLLSGRFSAFEAFIAAMGLVSLSAAAAYLLGHFPFYTTRFSELLLIRNGAAFALGALIWLMDHSGVTLRRLLIAFLSGVGVALEIVVTTFPGNRGSAALPLLLFFVAIVALVVSLHFNQRLSKKLPNGVARIVRAAGLATYPLYLLHNVVGAVMLRKYVEAGLNDVAALCASLVTVGSLVALVVTIIEPQLQSALRWGLMSEKSKAKAA